MSAGQNVRRGYSWTVSEPKRKAHTGTAGAELATVMAVAAVIFVVVAALTDPVILTSVQHALGTAWTSFAYR